MSALSLLEDLDRMRRELQDDYPGWQIWYVFHRDGSATWRGRSNPWLSGPSPDHLRKLISQANPQTYGDAAAGALKEDASVDASGNALGIADVTACP